MKKLKSKLSGFTLVEIIIVIMLLAILSTIAFISYKNYTSGTRDSARISALQDINAGISLYGMNAGKYPNPENITGTGEINGIPLVKVGNVGTEISKLIQMKKIPVDPTLGINYVYGISKNQKYYQLASLYENIQSNASYGVDTTYASSYIAKVIGNYQGVLKYSSGSMCAANIPSLIFNGTGSVELTADDVGYVIDKNKNLPYFGDQLPVRVLSTSQVISAISNTGAVTYECDINQQTWNTNKARIGTSFGYDGDKIGRIIFGDTYDIQISPEKKPLQPLPAYECNGLVGSANPDQWGSDNGYPDFDLCTNTIVVNDFNTIATSTHLTNNPGARDVYAFGLQEGVPYVLEALGDDMDSDTAFFLYDDKGNKLAMNDDNGDVYRSRIEFTPNFTGYYYLGVMGYGDDGTYADYTLSISEYDPNAPVNGVCGADNGGAFYVPPTNLCSKGSSTSVEDGGEGSDFIWTCNGINGGTIANCSATHKIPPVCNYTQTDMDVLNTFGQNGDLEVYDENYTKLTNYPLNKIQWCTAYQTKWIGGAMVPTELFSLNLLPVLNLDGNDITSLPPEIGNMTSLQTLNLGYNQLASLPPEIGNLTSLQYLELSVNFLTSIPPEIGNLTNLQSLVAYSNLLTTLPPEIGNLPNILSISVSSNDITTLPLSLYNLTTLESLYLGYNQITTLAPEIGNLTNLKSLGVPNNLLTSLPVEIGNLVILSDINLSNNQITSLPSTFSNLIHMRYLSYDMNGLVTVPPEIFSLSQLESFYMRSNLIVTIPPEIGNLVHLTTIDFEGNQITTLPATFGNLDALMYLRVRNNKISTLPAGFFGMANLRSLYIESNQLATLPPEIGNLTSLTSLYLDGNPLTSVPPELGNLINLYTLYLRHTQLTSLPTEFSNLIALRTLHYGANPGTFVPEPIFNLPNLENLDLLDISSVTSISPSIANLVNLKSLSFRRASQLHTVPPEIGNLPKLERLYFGNSAITSLPNEIGNLPLLDTLILYNTQLTTLPAGMVNFQNLISFSISGTTGLGNFNGKSFAVSSTPVSQVNIPTAGKTMTISGNGTKIVITVNP